MKLNIIPASAFRIFTGLLLGSGVLCSGFIQTLACGGWEDSDAYYALIPDEAESWDPYAPYYLSGYTLFGRTDQPYTTPKSNLEAWSDYLGNARTDDILNLIFSGTEEELLPRLSELRNGALPAELANNEAAKWLARHPKSPVFDYLTFSKRCEKHFTRPEPSWWDEPIPADTTDMLELIKEGEKLEKKCRDKELRKRYRYQLLRLHFYLGHYDEVNAFYLENFAEENWNNELQIQALNYDFGAHFRKMVRRDSVGASEKAMVILKLATLLNRCSDCKLVLYEDLHRFNATDFFEADAALKDPESRIDVWMLASLRSVPLHICLDKILSIDPNAPEISSLLTRILQKAQSRRFGVYESALTDFFADEEWNQTNFILKKATLNNRIEDRGRFAFLMAYLDYLNGKIHKSRMELEKASIFGGGEKLEYHQRILSVLLDLEHWNANTLESPHLLPAQLSEVMGINHAPLTEYVFRRLAELADQNGGMRLEEVLFTAMYADVEGMMDLPLITALETSYLSQEKSVIERWIWSRQPITFSEILEWKADALLLENHFEEAAAYYSRAGRSQPMITDPFIIHIQDCHDCDHNEHASDYTRKKFTEKMVELKKQADAGDANSAFRYANGLYNKTHYGNSRDAVNMYYDAVNGSDYYWSMEEAAAAYRRALDLYRNPEDQARVTFMLAKCEQNMYFNEASGRSQYAYFSYANTDQCLPGGNREIRTHFEVLRRKYRQTKFYSEALKECSYFEHFVRVH